MLTIAFNLLGKKSSVKEGISFVSDFAINIESFSEIYTAQSYTADFPISLEVFSLFVHSKTENFLKAYKYRALAEITLEDVAKREKFLTDYHIINFLANQTGLDKVSITAVLVAISNLLRLTNNYEVDEMHFVSFRVFRKFSKTMGKNIFFITEY